MTWASSGGQTKSEAETTRLVNDALLQDDFDPADLNGFNAHTENIRLDRSQISLSTLPKFQESAVTIEVPSGDREIGSQDFRIPGLQYRSILSVIKSIFAEPLAEKFHFIPFKLFRALPGSDLLEQHDVVQRLAAPLEQLDCKLERVVLGLMFWSDSTHLASFRNANLWPIYMMFGNLSKYIRSRPNSGACQHIAYIPSLPASFHDFASSFFTKWSIAKQRKSLLTHCRRGLMHAVWKFLLDDEFVHAYNYGIVIQCPDEIEHRFYPQIFTYSVDYPEKDKGKCPCPRCLVEKSALDQMGLYHDLRNRITKFRELLTDAVTRARDFIYRLGFPINGTAVDNLLKDTSSIPTINSFVACLGTRFNVPQMLAVDLLHEIELGVWQTLFTHLIRMLYAAPHGPILVARLDER
ncbi:hypothetical protein DFJ43DRAFT_1133626 [Lentinula guzmanii]|uniref:Uncharacterized protein n=1 Tax=Lentinula guzmanii TaxID=2804957 RepID=A0AA38MYB2_9AGAR|nr:hypothetical protein DFJ43DRAFT_1133626 [Lentinula guzmanii]